MLTRFVSFQFSPKFIRTTGSEVIEKWEGKDLFSPLAAKSGGAFALHALQLVPPLSEISIHVAGLDLGLGVRVLASASASAF